MDFLLEALTNWLKEMLVGGIMSNLSGMFDSVNQQVADISVQVGQTPQAVSYTHLNASGRNCSSENTADRGTGGFEEAAGYPILGTESHPRHRRKQRAAQETAYQRSLAG